jgi:hypothetical protein
MQKKSGMYRHSGTCEKQRKVCTHLSHGDGRRPDGVSKCARQMLNRRTHLGRRLVAVRRGPSVGVFKSNLPLHLLALLASLGHFSRPVVDPWAAAHLATLPPSMKDEARTGLALHAWLAIVRVLHRRQVRPEIELVKRRGVHDRVVRQSGCHVVVVDGGRPLEVLPLLHRHALGNNTRTRGGQAWCK